ncbi:MAG: SDR family NAD(P)-dependent oxidoreductase [Deltaproteobacteria bacterium]|nr:SDR family NAD(P)-dependent oxidoreductase [Deltaproteobacteria bacterium]
MTSIAGKVAFVTGGASGIGLGLAEALAQRGARVVIADIEAAALDRARAQVARGGAEVLALRLDVTDRAAFAAASDAALARFGAVHLLFNNAGVNADGPLDRVTYQDWDWVLGVNLGGVVNGLTTFLPELKRHGREAHVANTASVGGLVGMRNLGIYNASKFAVVGLSEALRADMKPHGVGVSVLCPGVIATALPTSARNRPAALGGGAASAPAPASAAAPQLMTPAQFAAQVMDAVLANRFFVSSHAEFRELVGQRNRAVDASYRGEADPAAVSAMRALIEPF